MLPTLVTDSAAILRYQKRLEAELKKQGQEFEARYQTRGFTEGMRHPAYYFHNNDIYWKSGDSSADNRYWNSFGAGKPTDLKDAFQLNVPKSGVNRRVQGGFLERHQEVFLLHRGPLGGGRKDGSHNLCEMVPELVGSFNDAGIVRDGVIISLFEADGDLYPDFFDKIALAVRAAANELARR